jgi:hypothetical protein
VTSERICYVGITLSTITAGTRNTTSTRGTRTR